MNADWDQFGSGPGDANGDPSAVRRNDPPARREDAPADPFADDLYASAEPTLYPFDTSGSFEWSPPIGRAPDDAGPPAARRDRTPREMPAAAPIPPPPAAQAPPAYRTPAPPAPARPDAGADRDAPDATTPTPHPTPSPSNIHSSSNIHSGSKASGSAGSGHFYSDDSIEFVDNPVPGMEFDGTYRFVQQIGKGGMGSVWEVTRLKFNSPRALKLIVSKYVSDPNARKRFAREARIMEKLRHPHAVTVYRFKMSQERAYIEMELLSGKPLNKALTPGHGMPVDVVGRLVDQLCDVLQAAHDEGIVHRDLKPANIFLVRDEPGNEFLKVLDFGIAKLERPDSVADHDEEALTVQGAFLGTVHYASPEQIEGKKVDHRSDIYSVGVILYELLTGFRPYAGVGMEVGLKHVAGQVPAFADRAPGCNVPPGIERVVRRCMAKSPGDRFSSAVEISEAFRKALERTTLPDPSPDEPDATPGPAVAADPEAEGRDPGRSTSRGADRPTDLHPVTGPYPALDPDDADDDFGSALDDRPIDPLAIAGAHLDSVPGARAPALTEEAVTIGTRTRQPETATDPSTSLKARRQAASSPAEPAATPARSGKIGLILGGVGLLSLGVALALVVPMVIDRKPKPADEGKTPGGTNPPPVATPTPTTPSRIPGLPDDFEAAGEEMAPGLNLPLRIKKVLKKGEKPVEITFILVPGGRFNMGTDDPKVRISLFRENYASEFPAPMHEVRLTRFYIQETEVTNAQFKEYLESTGRVKPDDRPPLWESSMESDGKGLEHPAIGMSWDDARNFATWVSKEHGDLPTEAQWEYVARSLGDNRMYVGRSQPTFKVANVDSRGADLRHPTTTPVRYMDKDATEQGVLGMTGNVREWCRDVLCAYTKSQEPVADPFMGPDSENVISPPRHVIRGGSYRTSADRSMTFGPRYPQRGIDTDTVAELDNSKAAMDVGFRIVIQPAETPR